jgi:ubiquitin-protein ligase
MSRRRWQRLEQEFEAMTAMHERNGLVHVIAAFGNPPEHYIIGFRCRGVERVGPDQEPVIRQEHRLELQLTVDFPRLRPLIYWHTPIYHPNFNDNGHVCIVEWYAKQTLPQLCEAIAEMVQYKIYDTTSPLNMDAALWAMYYRNKLPIDPRNLFDPTLNLPSKPSIARKPESATVIITGTRSITSPTTRDLALEPGEKAPHCGGCGYKFNNPDAVYCPLCGSKRWSG